MKAKLQWLFSLVLIVAGIMLLIEPAHAQGFAPTRFTVIDQGTTGKPDVVLIPGLSSSREVWSAEGRMLAPNYRLHLLQINGFAGQPAGSNASGEILPAVVDELHRYVTANKMQPVVIGHSLGGLLALMLAKQYPQDARKIVIVDSLPFYGMMFGPAATVELVRPQGEKMRDALIAQNDEQRVAGAKQTAAALVLDPAGRMLVAKNSIDSDRSVFARAMFEDLQTDLRSGVAKIKAPTLMLYPFDATAQGPDPARIDALYQSAYKPMPNAKLVRVDASRHFIQLDQPEKFDSELEAFLK